MISITKCHTQSSSTVEALYATYHGPVLTHLKRLVDDQATAEDLCQETFLKVLRAWESGAPIVNVSAWLYRIATNTAYDHLRRRRCIHFTPLSEALPAPSGASAAGARRARPPVPEALRPGG